MWLNISQDITCPHCNHETHFVVGGDILGFLNIIYNIRVHVFRYILALQSPDLQEDKNTKRYKIAPMYRGPNFWKIGIKPRAEICSEKCDNRKYCPWLQKTCCFPETQGTVTTTTPEVLIVRESCCEGLGQLVVCIYSLISVWFIFMV